LEIVAGIFKIKTPTLPFPRDETETLIENFFSKDSGLKTCGSNACVARVLGQNNGFCLSWLIVNKRGEVTVFRGLLRIEIDLVSSSISKVFAQQGVQ